MSATSFQPMFRPVRARRPRSGRFRRPLSVLVVAVLLFLIWRALHYSTADDTSNTSSAPDTTSNESTNQVAATNDAHSSTNDRGDSNTNVASNENSNTESNTNNSGNENSSLDTNASSNNPITCPGIVSRHGTKPNIALTFDAGSGIGTAEDIANILVETHTPAVFFLTGKWIEQNTTMAESLVKDGFPIYNHSYSHPHPAKITAEQLTTEITKTESIITGLGASDPKPFFRPPYGETNAEVLATVKAAGYCAITWTIDALDWQDGATPTASLDRVLSKATNGAIVLMHVGDDVVPKFLPELIAGLRSKGFTLVSLANLFSE